jgi:hypothetical protein
MNIYYQEGGQEMGQEEQLMQLFQAFADIVQDDEFNTAEEVMQMFMELAPEEQQAFVQQAIQIIQQEQGEPELESNPEEELMEQQEVQPMMQQGGVNPQKIQQILQAYASSIGEDPNVILQQFQQMQPEEQQQALQEIVQQLQGGEEPQQMKDGGYVNNTGYLEGYESSNNPYNIIPSNKISMRGVRPDIQYIKGTDNLGNVQYMDQGGEYKFDGDFVVEEPVYAQSGTDNDLTKQLQQLEVLLNQKNKDKQLQLQQLNQQKQTLENQRKIREVNFLYDKELKEINNLKQKITLSLPNVLKNPQNYNLDSKLKEFKNTLNYVNKKVRNLDRLNVDNFDIVGKDQQRVYIRPKKESGITLKGVSPGGIPMSIEYSDLPNVENKIPKKLSQYEIDKQTGFVPQQSTLGKQKNATTPANQDKPKIKLPDKKTKIALSETETPFVLKPPPVPTEIPEQQDTFDYRQPLIVDSRFDKYAIPEEEREINFTPLQGAFDRSNVGVGKRFFNQRGGYNYAQDGFKPRKFENEINFDSRLNPDSSMNMGAKSDGDFEYAYPDKKRAYFVNGATQLDPINQYDTMPMGANSMNYEAPNAESMKMWNRGSDRILDLANYADRYGVEHFGLNTKPISNQNVDRRSKFQQFMDKYGKKAEYSFNNRQSNLASAYNLAKASEPLTSQYRPNISLKYAEAPMLDPLPAVQELYNQRRLATQNVNANSPTGQAFTSNIDAKLQNSIMQTLNDIQQKNAQIAAQNEAGRVNAYNQEQQLNIAANQQYMQAMQQAQAQKDEMMGSTLGNLDRMRNSRTKSMNDFNSLAAMTPGMKKTNNPLDLLSGRQGFDMDKDYQKLYYAIAQAKTPEEAEALRKAYENKKKQAAEKVVAQTGGSINSFFKKKYI